MHTDSTTLCVFVWETGNDRFNTPLYLCCVHKSIENEQQMCFRLVCGAAANISRCLHLSSRAKICIYLGAVAMLSIVRRVGYTQAKQNTMQREWNVVYVKNTKLQVLNKA